MESWFAINALEYDRFGNPVTRQREKIVEEINWLRTKHITVFENTMSNEEIMQVPTENLIMMREQIKMVPVTR
jgi:adenine-specific DNA methylase